jgi:U2-associated protein SR140
VADIIVSSLLVEGTVVPRKLARLHLICDILHNSAASVPSAWKFRQEFQARLGIVFDHLANIYHSFPGRITADLFKKQITTVVDIWEDWIVFPPDFTSELRRRLEGPEIPSETVIANELTVQTENKFASKFKTSSFQLAAQSSSLGNDASHASDGEPMEVSSDEEKRLEDLDGEPVDDVDIDGMPVDDIDGEPIVDAARGAMDDDLDGEPIVDVDGVPVEGDIDGIPIDS